MTIAPPSSLPVVRPPESATPFQRPQPSPAQRRLEEMAAEAEANMRRKRNQEFREFLGMFVQELSLPSINALATAQTALETGLRTRENEMQETLRQQIREQRRTARNMALLVGVLLLLVLVLAGWLWLGPKFGVMREPAATTQAPAGLTPTVTEELAKAREETVGLQQRRDSLLSEIEAKQSAVESTASNLAAVQQALSGATQELQRLQRLQQTYQFRLLAGQGTKVFIQVEPSSRPFTQDGQTYIEVPSRLPSQN